MAFAKGQSGNPGGRPKDKPWREALMLALKDGGEQKLRRIADSVVAAAMTGDMQAVNEIANRLDGKPAQALTIGNNADGPLQMVITWQMNAGS